MFKVENLKKKYKNNETPVLDGISFELPEKGLFSIVGKSGSGKTTLLNILGLIDRKTEGEILFKNYSYSSLNEKDSDKIRKNEFSFIFQDFNLINDLTVSENLAIPLYIKNNTSDLKNKIEGVLKEIGLEGFKDKKISELSGGQIERVAIGRALIKESSVIFCDEPTANLDGELAESIFSLLRKISKKVLVIVVSHNVSLVEKFSDSILEINDHKLIIKKPFVEEKNLITQTSSNDSYNKKYNKAGFFNLLIIDIINSLKRNKLILIMSFFLLLVAVLFNTTFSLYNYNELSSYINSFEKNQNYCLRVSKYLENNSKYYDNISKKEEYLGLQVASYETTEDDHKLLSDIVNNDCDIYKNYTYNCPLTYFNDFGDIEIINKDYASSFMFFTCVQNFDKFYQPLKSGRLPQASNEVLIYDYMDKSFQYYNIFNESVLNKTITDYYSNVSFKVVGILKSEYEKWIGFNDNIDNKGIGFSLSNLNELRTIVGFEDYLFKNLNMIQKNPQFIKVNFIKGSSASNYDVVKTYYPNHVQTSENQLLKTFTWDESVLNYISEEYRESTIKNFRGFAITKKFAMDLVSISDENEFDETSFGTRYKGSEAFLSAFRTQVSENIQYKGDLYAFYSNARIDELFGIIDDSTNSKLYFFPGYFSEYVGTHNNINGIFSYFLISLSKDKYKNARIISRLIIPPDTKKEDAYYENLSENKYYFFLYDGTAALIGEAKTYVEYISSIIKVFFIISIIISVVFSFYFIFSFIKKNFYKYSLYKSMGLSNKRICFLSAFLPFLLVFLAFIISIPFSYLSMHFVNSIFITNFFNLNLAILNFESISILYSFLLIFGTISLGVIYPIINLYKLTPLQLIKAQK